MSDAVLLVAVRVRRLEVREGNQLRDPLHSHCDLHPVIPDLWKLYEVTNVKNR